MSTAAPTAEQRHRRMLGATVVRHIPGQRKALSLEQQPHGLFLIWLAYMGLLVFGAVMLWEAGAWHRLVKADPTGLTVTIVVLFVLTSLWVGKRAWMLCEQRRLLDTGSKEGLTNWGAEYRDGCALPDADRSAWLQVLGERAHGPHEMAWWINGIQLKLGLLGKVIGFSILAFQLGQMESFDPNQSTLLLKNLTGGLGIALLTTVTGLAGNILLGIQLMRLDRFADALIADTLARTHLSAPISNGASDDGDRPDGP